MKNNISVPFDIYQSEMEVLVVIPLGWITKDSIKLKIHENQLVIFGIRKGIKTKENFAVLEANCYRWDINFAIDLPQDLYFKDIKSTLSPENILMVTIPKTIEPDDIFVNIE